ncbi:MAG: Gfo/Idh/MocA family oxidoreductase [Spirochaetales bacterium]|nr:Gfo/Idh/MocA family oxidoreductase [Spirochaetales bacterium]
MAVMGWGIMGAGLIAQEMARAIALCSETELRGVGSQSLKRAQDWVQKFPDVDALSYNELLNRKDIQAVYVATTHNFHKDCVLAALKAGKHVVVEKPFCVNQKEAREMAELARQSHLFLMEALWVRFLPSHQKLKSILASGVIGEIHQVSAVFGKFVEECYRPRLIDPSLAGGATLDLFCYPLSIISHLLDALPLRVVSDCRKSKTGVDEISNAILRYPSGVLAQVSASYDLRMESRMMFYGTLGHIECPEAPFGKTFIIHKHDGTNHVISQESLTVDDGSVGFLHQLQEAVRCIQSGLMESPIIPVAESVALMGVMDGMRREWGLLYPFEKASDLE